MNLSSYLTLCNALDVAAQLALLGAIAFGSVCAAHHFKIKIPKCGHGLKLSLVTFAVAVIVSSIACSKRAHTRSRLRRVVCGGVDAVARVTLLLSLGFGAACVAQKFNMHVPHCEHGLKISVGVLLVALVVMALSGKCRHKAIGR